MRWLTVAGILLYLTRCSDAAVLKCSTESRDPLCASEKRDISPPPTPPDVECLAGSEWESNCHYCRCSDTGVAECLKQDSCDLQVFEEPIKCKPLTSFLKDCNTCTCLENGLGLCTLKGCGIPIDIERRKRQTSEQDIPKTCEPGSKWNESCNSCWCTDAGVSVCTKIGCVTETEAPAQGPKECEPGTTWKKSCNRCWCTSNGITICTKKGCYPNVNSSSVQKRDTSKSMSNSMKNHVIVKRGVCKANQEFQVDCNPCKCAANGQSYTCAHSECLEGGDNTNKEVEVFMESEVETTTKSSNNTKRVVCVANRMFIMDCNTCWCNEDGTSFFCTRRICTPEENNTEDPEIEMKLRVIKKECLPNEVFELDCNMCRCSADGKSFSCTRRACVVDDEKNASLVRNTRAVQEAPKTCQPGTEFRMDCNKCLCNDEGQDFSCTRIDCAAQNGNGGGDAFASTRSKRESLSETVSMQCVAGSVFDRDCNVCRCTEDGLHAVCTLKRCKQETTEPETPKPDAETSPNFRCTPGDQFKRDCKDCTCSADGKTFFCTLRLCDEELADIHVVL